MPIHYSLALPTYQSHFPCLQYFSPSSFIAPVFSRDSKRGISPHQKRNLFGRSCPVHDPSPSFNLGRSRRRPCTRSRGVMTGAGGSIDGRIDRVSRSEAYCGREALVATWWPTRSPDDPLQRSSFRKVWRPLLVSESTLSFLTVRECRTVGQPVLTHSFQLVPITRVYIWTYRA